MNRGGVGKCAVCTHSEKEEIDTALAAQRPLAGLSKKYGMSIPALSRHRTRHLNADLAALNAEPTISGGSFIERMDGLIGRAEGLLKAAEKTRQVNQALQAIKELGRLQELRGKATGELDERPTTVINLLTTAEWIEIRTHLRRALTPFPDAWEAVAASLTLGEPSQ
jgi:hypothetical protein